MNDQYLEVLQKYEGEVLGVRRGRGAWICEMTDGMRLLREYRGTVKRLEFEEAVLGGLQKQSGIHTEQYIRNQEGELCTSAEDGTKYILKDWFCERECNLRDRREILFAVTQIAMLHQGMKQIIWQEEWNLGSILPQPLSKEQNRHNQEMKRVRTFIRNKRKKNEFELCVMQNFTEFYEQALEAQQGLEQLEASAGQTKQFLCHGDLNQHHILIGDAWAAFIEFSQMHLGNQMADLYHFMRKVMEKHEWEERLGMEMIEAYDAVQTLGGTERSFLYYLFLYPEKYWKQLNYYNNGNKAWIPEKNVSKLKKLELQQEKRSRFLSKIKE